MGIAYIIKKSGLLVERRQYQKKKGGTGVRLRFQKGDFLAIGAVLLLAAAVFALFLPKKNPGEVTAEIYLRGQCIRRLPLTRDQEFTVTGDYTNTITVSGGKIAVTDSDCPGRDCVSCGWAGSAGRSIVCLPNGLEIRIVGGSSEVDFVVG